jgi:hypothetical protein
MPPPLRFGSDRDTLNKVFKEAIIKANFGPWGQPPSVLLGGVSTTKPFITSMPVKGVHDGQESLFVLDGDIPIQMGGRVFDLQVGY